MQQAADQLDVNTAIVCNCGSLCVLQDNTEDSHRISPSPVVHVRGLCEAVVEADLIDALEKFGPIWWVYELVCVCVCLSVCLSVCLCMS